MPTAESTTLDVSGLNSFIQSMKKRDRQRLLIALAKETSAHWRLDELRESFDIDDFDKLITNYLQQQLLKSYNLWGDAWRRVCSTVKKVGFLTDYFTRINQFADLSDMGKTGGVFYETDKPSQEEVGYTIGEKGYIFSVDYRTLVSDRLDYFKTVGKELGVAAARTLHKTIFVDNIKDNPTLALDSVVLFHSTHNNEYAAGAAKTLNYSNLKGAMELMRDQTDLDGRPILIEPWALVVGNDNELAADLYTSSPNNPDTANSELNVLGKRLKGGVIHSPFLDTAWYVLANPAVTKGLMVGFLNDVGENPQVKQEPKESSHYFETHQTRWSVYHPYGTVWVDFRGIVRGST